jgi:predicted DNA-binding transcriptional regulator YafY
MNQTMKDRAVGLLRSHEFWTAPKLADDLQVSLRTIRRLLAALALDGIQIESSPGRGGGIRLLSGHVLPRLSLERQEVLNLLLCLAVAESLNSPLILTGIGNLRQKLGMALPLTHRRALSELRRRILVGAPASESVTKSYLKPSTKVAATLQESFLMNNDVVIRYIANNGHRTTRLVEPHYLLWSYPCWYMLALDVEKKSGRSFRLDRIEQIKQGERYFKLLPANILMPDTTAFFQAI